MDRRSWLLFILVCALWGIPYFFIKVALHDLSPVVIVFGRVVIGFLTVLPVVLAQGGFGRLRDRIGWVVGLAILEVTIPFLCIASGEQWITSSLTGILIATEPMFVALLALPFDPSERVGGRQLVGLLIGLAGVVVLLGLDVSGGRALLGAGLILLATLCYAGGALAVKLRFNDVSPNSIVAATLGITGLVTLGPAIADLPSHMPSPATVGALVALGIACTGIGFVAFFALIARAGAGRATVITYVTPTVAVLIGVTAGSEAFTLRTAASLLLILAGSWLATMRRPAQVDADRMERRATFGE